MKGLIVSHPKFRGFMNGFDHMVEAKGILASANVVPDSSSNVLIGIDNMEPSNVERVLNDMREQNKEVTSSIRQFGQSRRIYEKGQFEALNRLNLISNSKDSDFSDSQPSKNEKLLKKAGKRPKKKSKKKSKEHKMDRGSVNKFWVLRKNVGYLDQNPNIRKKMEYLERLDKVSNFVKNGIEVLYINSKSFELDVDSYNLKLFILSYALHVQQEQIMRREIKIKRL